MDYFLARYYSSAQGRFTSPDEFVGGPDELYDFADSASENPTFYADISDPQSLNKYQYCYNNPLACVDPDGHGVKLRKDQLPFGRYKGPKVNAVGQAVLAAASGPLGWAMLLADPPSVGAPTIDNPNVGNSINTGDILQGMALQMSLFGMARPTSLPEAQARIARAIHAKELGTDPAIGGKFRAAEAEAGLRLESQVGRLRRDPTGHADFIGARGTYDLVGAGLKSKNFNFESFTGSISEHLRQSGITVVADVRRLNNGQRFSVDTYIRGLSQEERNRVRILQ